MKPRPLKRPLSLLLLLPVFWFGRDLGAQSDGSFESFGSLFEERFEPRPPRSGRILRLELPGSRTSRVVALDAGSGTILWSHEGPELHSPLTVPRVRGLGKTAFRLAASTTRGSILYEPMDPATGWPTGVPTPLRLVSGLARLPLSEPLAFGDRILVPVWTDRETAEIYAARFDSGTNTWLDEEVLSLRVSRHPTFASTQEAPHFVSPPTFLRSPGTIEERMAVVVASGRSRAIALFRSDPLDVERVIELPIPGEIVDLHFDWTESRPGKVELDGWVVTELDGRVRRGRYDPGTGRMVQVLGEEGRHLAGPIGAPEELWFAAAVPGATTVTSYREEPGRYGGASHTLPVREALPLPLRESTGTGSVALLHRSGVGAFTLDGKEPRPLDASLTLPLRSSLREAHEEWWIENGSARGARLVRVQPSGEAEFHLALRWEADSAILTRVDRDEGRAPWRQRWETILGTPRDPSLIALPQGWLWRTHGRLGVVQRRGISVERRTLDPGHDVGDAIASPEGRILALGEGCTLFDARGEILARQDVPFPSSGTHSVLLRSDAELIAVRLTRNGEAWTAWSTGRRLNTSTWRLSDSLRGIGSVDAAAGHGPHLYLSASDQVYRLRLSLEDGRPSEWDVFSLNVLAADPQGGSSAVDFLLPHPEGIVIALRSLGARLLLSLGWEEDRPALRARITEPSRDARYAIAGETLYRLDRDVLAAGLRSARSDGEEVFREVEGLAPGRLGATAVHEGALYLQVRSREGILLQKIVGARATSLTRTTRFAAAMIVTEGTLLGVDAHGQIFRMNLR